MHMPAKTPSGLIERRASLAAELEQAKDRAAVLIASLRQIDRTIQRRGSNRDPATISPLRLLVSPGPRERGPIVRPILSILRTAGRPMTLREITLRVIEARGLDAADARVLRNVSEQVKKALANQRRQRVVGVVRAPTGSARYCIAY